MNVPAQDRPSYNLTVKNGKFTEICFASGQEDPGASISQDGRAAEADVWKVRIANDDKSARLVIRYPDDYGCRHHPLVDGVFRLSYRGNGRAYSKHLRPADLMTQGLMTQNMRPLPFRFCKFRITRCYQAAETDGVFRHDWVTEGDLARELNWVFSDGEVTRRFVDHDQAISSLAAPALYNSCDTLETVVRKSSWTVYVHVEQRQTRGMHYTVALCCSDSWPNLTHAELKARLESFLKLHCHGAGSFLKPLEVFLL